MTVSVEYSDVADLVRSAVNTIIPQIEKNRNRLHVHCPTDIGILNSDATKVRQALINLLSNAAKFTEDGEVTLTVSRYQQDHQTWFRFVVADTGIGIPADKQDKLFKAFSQVDDSPNRKFGGTGLGLVLSQRLCELVGGRITMESTVGVGSTFTMEVPATLSNSLITSTSDINERPSQETSEQPVIIGESVSLVPVRNAIILVIDDDPTVGTMIQRLMAPGEAYVVTSDNRR